MPRDRAGAIATLLGLNMLVSVVTLAVLFVFGSPFGAINDWTIGIGGVLTALLVVNMDRSVQAGVGVATALAVLGSVIVVIGAALVISYRTGFLLAGLVESFGFALVGIWLIGEPRQPSRIGERAPDARRRGRWTDGNRIDRAAGNRGPCRRLRYRSRLCLGRVHRLARDLRRVSDLGDLVRARASERRLIDQRSSRQAASSPRPAFGERPPPVNVGGVSWLSSVSIL
jgi:hypothetical protein